MPRKVQRPGTPLTPREKLILQAWAEGKIRKQLPEVIGKSLWVVDTDIKSIYERMGMTNKVAIVAKLIREGVI